MKNGIFRAIGMMSGTSLDGVDVALVETDGKNYARPMGFFYMGYEASFRQSLRDCIAAFANSRDGKAPPDLVAAVERELTRLHLEALEKFIAQERLSRNEIDVVGFHGQTVMHRPEKGVTIQLGDGDLLAESSGIAVVNDFRSADIAAGGQGAPLAPLYHRALASALPKPLAVVNIGGVSNITWIGGDADDEILAFDSGPGNAMMDDWILARTGKPCDTNGEIAARGKVDAAALERFLSHRYFSLPPPKSLDRDEFSGFMPEVCVSDKDGAATLTMMTAQAIARGIKSVPSRPLAVYVAGGGRHNATLMRWTEEACGVKTLPVEALGWNGDALEAEAFAWLAARSLLGLPLSLPNTTGIARPQSGGKTHRPRSVRGETA